MSITKNSQIDLNGNEMILDADGDTTITADTDDQLDIKVAGSDKVQINATGLGIGQVPTRDLSLHAGDASSVFAHFTNTDTGTTSSDGLLIGLGSSEDLVLNNQESSKNIIFENGGSERLRIASSGELSLGVTANNTGGTGDINMKGNQAIRWMHATDGTQYGDMYVDTSNNVVFRNTSSSTERMRISSSGNVGIGDSNPGAKLDVNSGTTNTLAHFHSTDDNAFIELKDDDTTGYIGVQNDYVYVGGAPSTTDQNIVIHKTSGNVGISWAAPTARLGILQNGSTTPGMNITDGASADFRVFAGYVSGTTRIGTSAGNLAIDTAGTERMRLDTSGRFLLGTTTINIDGASGSGVVLRDNASSLFTVESDECMGLNRRNSDGIILRFRNDGVSVGTISTGSNSLPSDRNFKRDIEDLEVGLDLIKKLKPAQYNYKVEDDDAPKLYGLIAQDLEQSLAEVGVEKNSTSLLQHNPNDDEKESDYDLDYLKLTPVLINAIQEQQEQIESLQQEIEVLKNGN